MRLPYKKAAAVMTFIFFLVPSSAHAATLEGQVLSLDAQAGGLWKVVVQGEGGKTTFMLSAQTAVQKEVPVEELKAGDRLVTQRSGSPGVKGLKDPLGSMSDATKKALGLPNIPNIPEIPKMPPMPDKNQMFKGQAPAGPGGGAPAGPGGGPAQAAGAPGAEAEGPQKKPAEEPKVKTQDEMLQEQGFQNEKLLFPPKAGEEKQGEEVTQVSKTDMGYEVTVVSETGKPEKKTYAPGNTVLKVAAPSEVKKNDKVVLNFDDKDKSVTELKVKA